MPPKTVQGKNVLVTGAASGIGRATAIAAAAKGAKLFLTDVSADALASTAEEIKASGGDVAYSKPLDIADYEAVKQMAGEIHTEHGSLDIVMNIAGIAVWGRVQDLTYEQWKKTIDVNLMGPISVIELFVPPMVEAGRGGHIVNVSSAAGLFGLPWHAPYSATKFGLRGLSEVLRFDLRRHHIGVQLVLPGAVDTGLVKTVEVAGVNTQSSGFDKLRGHFKRTAASPEQAAERIIKGIERNRYWVYTSNDIRLAFFWQRRFETPYTWIMRAANARFGAMMIKSRR